MSAEECIMAGELQNQHPSPCKLAAEGHFGSKFTTCIVTGECTLLLFCLSLYSDITA